jgi:hypothetical protein
MNKIILALLGLITCSMSQASVTFIDGATRNGDFSNSTLGAGAGYFSDGANLKSTHTTWNYASAELDWTITAGQAVADSQAGTGFGQAFLKSGFGTGWEGQTSLSLSVDWTTQGAGDTLEYAVVGFKNTGVLGEDLMSLSEGTVLTGATFYSTQGNASSFLPGGPTDVLDTIGSGILGSGTFTASLTVAGTDLADYDALAIMFFSTIDGSGGQVTIDNVSLSSIPEPGACALLAGLGCLALLCFRRRTSK